MTFPSVFLLHFSDGIIIFLGRPLEDEVFGLPGGNYPKERGHRNLFHYGSGMKAKRFSSLDKVDSSGAATQAAPAAAAASVTSSGGGFSKRPRKYSLERDVYYFENNRREEVRLEAYRISPPHICRTCSYAALFRHYQV